MHQGNQRHDRTSRDENKTGTIVAHAGAAVTVAAARRVRLCGYVVAAGAAPFCDRPALAGSSYCADHRALCAVRPASPGFAALADAQVRAARAPTPPPPELGWLAATAPESFDESDDERLAGLDLPTAAASADE